jgi:hypothetical protein
VQEVRSFATILPRELHRESSIMSSRRVLWTNIKEEACNVSLVGKRLLGETNFTFDSGSKWGFLTWITQESSCHREAFHIAHRENSLWWNESSWGSCERSCWCRQKNNLSSGLHTSSYVHLGKVQLEEESPALIVLEGRLMRVHAWSLVSSLFRSKLIFSWCLQ